jgi:crotonobetainyl-CoA:carnitine CoA-transferase CaiB-like acyl-CoA transferase
MHPLENIRVTDFTTMINGPFAAMMLSDMGADVIKVEPPFGDSWRAIGGGFLCCNRGKRAIALDLKKNEARQIIYDLIAVSDVVVENARWGVWHKLGIDYDSVKKIRPDLIYLSILGHGEEGPYSRSPGFDPVLQARSGQMVGQGGIGNPPVYHRIALNDQAAPMLGAFGAMLGLLSRIRRGKGQHVVTSLTNASVALQAGEFIDYAGLKRSTPGDVDLRGLNALCRHYMGKDGRWFFVLCIDDPQWRALVRATGLEPLESDMRFNTSQQRAQNDSALVEIFQDAFKEKTAAEWTAVLQRSGMAAALAQNAEEVLNDPHCRENDLFDERKDPIFGSARLFGIGTKLSETPGVIRRPAPLLGQHTTEVLRELGYGSERIAALKAAKVIYTAE